MRKLLMLAVITLAISACTESTEESFDSSVETTVAKTIAAVAPVVETGNAPRSADQQTSTAIEPPQTSIFCPDCELVDVTGIVDGDTIDTSVGRVRFFGIDAPEKGEECFTEATEFTRLLVGIQVGLEDGPRLEDSFGRRLAYVYDPVGNSIDVQLVARGFATAWTRDGQHRDTLIELEHIARGNNAGCLWSVDGVVAARLPLPIATASTTQSEEPLNVPATVAAAFTATAKSVSIAPEGTTSTIVTKEYLTPTAAPHQPDMSATVAAAFTTTAVAAPAPINTDPPDVPATVAAAFTATAVAAPVPTSTSHPPYVPQFTDHLLAVDELAQSPSANDGFGMNHRFIASAYSLFGEVRAMYWLKTKLGTEPSSSSGYVEFALNSIHVFVEANARDAAQSLLVELAEAITDVTRLEVTYSLVWEPTDEDATRLCTIGVEAIHAGMNAYAKSLLPAEPMCPIVIASYHAYGTDSEFGFLGHVSEKLLLGLLAESEVPAPTPSG